MVVSLCAAFCSMMPLASEVSRGTTEKLASILDVSRLLGEAAQILRINGGDPATLKTEVLQSNAQPFGNDPIAPRRACALWATLGKSRAASHFRV
jgi:hypothetical protein